MKVWFIAFVFSVIFLACHSEAPTYELENYLNSFNLKIYQYKVICIVPVDGYGKYINPSLIYAKDSRNDFLLVMSSKFKKSIENTAERLLFQEKNYICDYNNLARQKDLVDAYAPSYYFIRYGEVIKRKDIATEGEKTEIFDEVENFFIEEDALNEEMEKIIELKNKHDKIKQN
jgi:hypothetical protein